MMPRIGIGTARLRLTVEQLSGEDWAQVSHMAVRLLTPSGEITEHAAELDREARQVNCQVECREEGAHRAGIKAYFNNNTSMTSHTAFEYLVTDGL